LQTDFIFVGHFLSLTLAPARTRKSFELIFIVMLLVMPSVPCTGLFESFIHPAKQFRRESFGFHNSIHLGLNVKISERSTVENDSFGAWITIR
jgi:hypothetical protein